MWKLSKGVVPKAQRTRRKFRSGGGALRPAIFSIVATLLLVVMFTAYTRNLQTLVDDESDSYLEEIATQVSINLKDKLSYHNSVLDTYARIIERNKELPMPALLDLLEPEKESYSYRAIALIDVDGYVYSTDGKVLYPELLPYIATMKQEQRPITSSVMNLFGTDCSAFLSPLPPIIVDGITLQGVMAAADMEALTNSFSLTVFNNQGFSHIITPNGSVVLRATSENNQFDGYNLLTYLSSKAQLKDITADQLREDLKQGKSGRIQFYQQDGTKMSAFYVPADYEDWYLFTVIPSDILTSRTSSFYSQTVWALVILTVFFIALLLIIMWSQRQKKRELLKALHTDVVTGGRSMLKFELDVTAALQDRENEFSLLYANVEKFKLRNEQLGRSNADQLLCYIHQTIQNSLNEKDKEYVSRLMADHFGILVHMQDLAEIQMRVEQWDQKIKEYSLQIHAPSTIRLTYGVLPVDSFGGDVAVLLDRANMACRLAAAKNSDGCRIGYYDELVKKKILLEQEMESRQEAALEAGEFKMFLQPKYNPHSNTIAGAEALVRWVSPDKGVLFPDQYIPLFESNGFIVKLDLFIFEEACRFIDNYCKSGAKPAPISVNLSRINLNYPNFLERFAAIWQKYQFDAALLEFEITESVLFDNMELLDQTIAAIHEYGFHVSMDDFGSGYSSLNMLKNLDVDVIKLDRQFFMGWEDDAHKGNLIVATMISLCQKLGIHVVAEGVETEEQVAFLRQQNCDLIQGYYYAKPMPHEQFLLKLQNETRESSV